MKKRRSTRLINAGDILLTVICLIGMAIAVYLFWDDLNVTLSKQDEAPIAVVYFKQNTVQRRLVDRNLWERIQVSAPVYEGDRIRTSAMSEAVTVFADGTEIEIHENTLIQVYTQKERAAVDFVSGAITATAAGFEGEESAVAPLLIKTGDKVVELDSGSAVSVAAPVVSSAVKGSETAGKAVTPEKAGKVAVTVTKGTAAVRDAKKEDTYKQQTSASSVTKVAQSSITDFGETARQVFTAVTATPESASVELAAGKKVIQTGEVSFVETVKAEGNTDGEETPETAEMAAEADGVTAVPERTATLYLPVSSTSIRLEEGRVPIITAQWESSEDLMFEFSRDASFASILFTRVYPENQTQAYILLEDYAEEGNLFWRVRFAADPDSSFASGVILLQASPEESEQEMIDRVLNDEETVPLKDEPDTQEEAIKAEAVRKEEEERKAREDAARLDAENAEKERLATIKAEEERIAAEKAAEEARLAEEARIAAEKKAAEEAEAARIAAEKKAAEEEAARIAAEKKAAEEAEAARIAAEKKAAEEAEAARIAAEKKAAEEAEAARIAEEKKAAEEAEAARIAAEKKAAEEAEAARIAAEKKAAEEARLAEEARIAAEKKAAEEAEAARIAAEKKAAEEAEAARIAAEKKAAEEAEAARIAAEKKAAEEEAARIAAEKKAAEEEAARIAAEKKAAEEAEAARIAAEKKAAEEAEAARIAAEKKAAEEEAEAARIAAEKKAAEEAETARIAAENAALRQAFAAATPGIISPAAGRTLDDSYFDANSNLTFSWTSIPNASSYHLVVRSSGTIFSKTIIDRYVSSSQYVLRTLSDLDEGEFEWTVTGRMSDGTESQTAKSTFTVKLDPLESVELDTSGLFKR